jgi:putative phage-type endonuclease
MKSKMDKSPEQGTDEWLAERAGHVTASKINDCMMAKTTAGYQNYMAQIVCERLTGQPVETFKSDAMQYGNDTEPQARAFYELETGNDVQECGFIKHPDIDWSGASPDGLIGDDGLVEIKCPQQAKHMKNLLGGTIDKGYRLQMQWQMECTGRSWCDFVSFNPSFPDHLRINIERVDRDEKLIAEMRGAVQAFLEEIDAKMTALRGRRAHG